MIMKYNKGLYLALIPLLLIFGGLSSTADNESDKVQCFDDEFSSMAPNERDLQAIKKITQRVLYIIEYRKSLLQE